MPYDAQGNWVDSPPWLDTINNLIWAGAQTAQVAETGGYPPGSNIIYAPSTQYPSSYPPNYPQYQSYPSRVITTTPGAPQINQQSPGFSFTGSTGLWVIGGIVLLALVMKKR